MIKKFICWIWGHNMMAKHFTGNQYDTNCKLTGNDIKGNYYIWKRLDHCLRCGEDGKDE